TMLSVVSMAKPKIANYPFTTLTTVLGVIRLGEGSSFVMADIPGLIEGAGEGVGLGHEFLRHVDRCRMLVHVLDASGSEGRDPLEDFAAINRELAVFDPALAERPQIVAANKCDLTDEAEIERLRAYFEGQGVPFFPIMAAIAEGTDDLINAVAAQLATLEPIRRYEPEPAPVEDLTVAKKRDFTLTVEDGVYIIEAPWLLKIMETIDPDAYDSLQYFQRVLRQSGIIDALEDAGIEKGDTVSIYDVEFDYVP
ncbi:MAG: Obg family GTPase CgtA, partial [Clostridia bacterium]|nr:Obg family GTPase CgtA [Clostridia bacterium]